MNINKIVIVLTLLSSYSIYANDKENGGDNVCEKRIEDIRENISAWINSGRSSKLDFSGVVDGKTHVQYAKAMQRSLEVKTVITNGEINIVAKSPVSCTDKAVIVKNEEKICGNDVNGSIVCNFKRFNSIAPIRQYELIHHEYAGVAGIETNKGDESDFTLSKQVSDKLNYEVILKLPIAPLNEKEFGEKVVTEKLNQIEFLLNLKEQIEVHKNKRIYNYIYTGVSTAFIVYGARGILNNLGTGESNVKGIFRFLYGIVVSAGTITGATNVYKIIIRTDEINKLEIALQNKVKELEDDLIKAQILLNL